MLKQKLVVMLAGLSSYKAKKSRRVNIELLNAIWAKRYEL